MLNELELRELEEMKEEEKKGIRVTDLGSANWAIRKLRALAYKENAIKELAKNEINRIKVWKDSELNGIQNTKTFFTSLLREYYEKEKEKDKKFTLSTPYGTFYTKSNKDKITIDKEKEEDLIKLFEEYEDEIVEVKKSINMTELSKRILLKDGKVYDKKTGELLEGINVINQDDTTVIRFKRG